jgi:hypothetical protein
MFHRTSVFSTYDVPTFDFPQVWKDLQSGKMKWPQGLCKDQLLIDLMAMNYRSLEDIQ